MLNFMESIVVVRISVRSQKRSRYSSPETDNGLTEIEEQMYRELAVGTDGVSTFVL